MKAKKNSKKQDGFSLIELLAAVAIILIIAAIAIPNVLASIKASKETAAAGNLRGIYHAEMSFQNYWGSGFQPLNAMADEASASAATCTLPNLLPAATLGVATPIIGGYTYEYSPGATTVAALSASQTTEGCVAGTTTFSVTAVPTDPSLRGYFIDQTGVVRFCDTGSSITCPATAASPALGN